MRKNFYLSGLFLCILALCVCGCGDSAADPMGTATVQFINENGDILVPQTPGAPLYLSILPGGSIHLIVMVTNARDGGATTVPVPHERVTFSLLTPGNGGSLTPEDRTDGNGRAVAFYTAGNNFEVDKVRVTTDAGATAQVTILKGGDVVSPRIATLLPASGEVAAGQPFVITAHVTDANSNPMLGETVTFTLPVNASGASFINPAGVSVPSISVPTDPEGNAVATYMAGSNDPLVAVYDTVRAALANSSSNVVVIKRSAEIPPTTVTP